MVCDDHDHEYQLFEEGQELEEIPEVTLVPDDRDHEFRHFEGQEVIEALKHYYITSFIIMQKLWTSQNSERRSEKN